MLRAVSQKPVTQITWIAPAIGVLLLSSFIAWRVAFARK